MASQPPIPLAVPDLGPAESAKVAECLASTFVSSVGPFVSEFEARFATAVGSPHAVACATGTAAIHLALRALGVGPGDLVLCSDFTFIASANPALYQGAELAFVGSEARSWNLDPALLEQALDDLEREGRRPKAVIAVHILGQPADLGPIADLCAARGVHLVEDAAEALGATYDASYPQAECRDRQVGTIGRIGCFSFNGNKIITTGGGGMCVTADAGLARQLKHLSTQAKLPGAAYIHDQVGYNYRLTNLAAALGLAQLERLPALLARKRAIAARYRALAAERGWIHQPALPGTSPSEWLPSQLVGPRRDDLIAHLEQRGIASRPLWFPLSQQPANRGRRAWGPGLGIRLADEGLSLPCSGGLAEADLDRVLAALAEWRA